MMHDLRKKKLIKYNDDLTRQIVNNTEKKIDKVTDAVSGNVAIFDNDGNVVDSDVAVNTLQSTDNLVAAFNEEPSDINYPSEKLVKDTFGLMGITIDKLWENPNPDTERGRSVELPSDGYDRYIVVVKYNLTYDIYINIIVSGDGKTYGGAIHRTGENFTYGTVSISNKQMTSNSAADTSFIPVEIYGIKVNINDLTTGA